MMSRSHSRVSAVSRKRYRTRSSLKAVGRRIQVGWRTTRALYKAFRTLPIAIQIVIWLAALLVGGLAMNWGYHALHKPTEVLFPLANTLDKPPFKPGKK